MNGQVIGADGMECIFPWKIDGTDTWINGCTTWCPVELTPNNGIYSYSSEDKWGYCVMDNCPIGY